MSFPVVRRPRGYGAPPEVEHLPFVLLRDALVTRDPELVAAGVEAFEAQEAERELYGGPQGAYALPQKMQFQQWKTPPTTGFANRPDHADPYATARALMLVRAEQAQREADLVQANNPRTYPIEHAAFDRRHPSGYAPVDTREVLFRDAPADGRPIDPLAYYTSPAEQLLGEDEELGPYSQGIQRSLEEVRATQGRLVNLLLSNVRGRR